MLVRLANPTISATPLDMPIVPGGVTTPVTSAAPTTCNSTSRAARGLHPQSFWRRKLLPGLQANVHRIVLERPGLTPKEAIEAVERNEIDLALAHGAPSEIPGS